MEFGRIWTLRGPNVWARVTVFEVELDLTALAARLPERLPGLRRVLADGLPAAELPAPAADPERHLAGVFGRLAVWLQVKAGSPVDLHLVHPGGRPHFYRVIVEYEEEALGRPCVEAARELCLAAFEGQALDTAAKLKELRDLAYDVRLGPSTAAIVGAARERAIPARRMNDGSLFQLGWAARQRRICTAETDRTGAIAESIAQDKQLTRSLLRAVGVPVPEGRPVADAEDAWRAAEELGVPVVVKPRYGNHGRGVATNLSTREQVLAAYAAAREESAHIIVETFAPGDDYRLLVIGDRLAAVALREPAHVVGDGRSTVRQLIDEVNKDPRRSDGHATVLSFVKIDPVALGVLAEQGHAPDSVPAAGEKVLIRRNANLSTGGTATDVTDRVHPDVAAAAVDAARVVGLDIAGVDVVALDIGRPLAEQRAAVVEVNAGPGLRMHLEPSTGTPRPVGRDIVDLLFPPGEGGRIPVVAVTGVNGKTTTTRLIAHVLRAAGRCVGMTCTDGTWVDGRRTETRDCSGPQSARAVLVHPRVEVGVFETARGGILREGLGFDRCDVAVVTNIGHGDHLGLRGVETTEDLARVKRVVVEAVAPGGVAVLNAIDPLVAGMAGHCPGAVVFFARDGAQPVLAAHLRRGGAGVFVRGGSVVLSRGGRGEETVAPLDAVPLTDSGRLPFQVDNVLAAVAACRHLGLSVAQIRRGLETFTGDMEDSPARFNVVKVAGATVIADYAHNPSALAALVEALAAFPPGPRTLVYSACDRRDSDVLLMGRIIGDGFDRVILYRDQGHGGRADGELNGLLRQGMGEGRRVREVVDTADEPAALELSLRQPRAGELIVLGVEAIEPALAYIKARVGQLRTAPG